MKYKCSKSLFIVLLTIILVSAMLIGCNKKNTSVEGEKVHLRISFTPGEDVVKKREKYKPFLDYFEDRTGYTTELFVATDFTAVIEAMRAGEVDIANYGPLSYVLAASVAKAEAFAADYKEGLGQFYEAYIIVHPDSGIEDIYDLRGKTFAYVDPASTGGYLIPTLELMEHGINPSTDFASMVFAGGHDACGLAVKNRNVDGATMVKHAYDRLREEGLIDDTNVKIIYTTALFPSGTWAFRAGLSEDVKEIVKDALLNLSDKDKEHLKDFMESTIKWVEAKDSDWDSLREAVKLLNIDLENQ